MSKCSLCSFGILAVVAWLTAGLFGCVQYHRNDGSAVGSGEGRNPFCPNTNMTFELPEPACVTLTIYNVLGHPVRVVVDEEMPAGEHSITWDAKDDDGNPMASGVYLWQVQTEGYSVTKKIVLVK